MDDLTADDVAAMREQGDFRAYLRSISAPTRQPAPTAPAPEPERDPGRRPGAWPAGCQRPTPPTPPPAAAWEPALTEYRTWVAVGCPEGNFPCQCGACPKETS